MWNKFEKLNQFSERVKDSATLFSGANMFLSLLVLSDLSVR